MRRATACSRRYWRPKVIRRHREPPKPRSAGRAPWATSRIWSGDRPVGNERDARVSLHHCAACALLMGAAGVAEFSEAVVFRPDLIALRQKITAMRDERLPDGAARVTIQLASGETLGEIVTTAK